MFSYVKDFAKLALVGVTLPLAAQEVSETGPWVFEGGWSNEVLTAEGSTEYVIAFTDSTQFKYTIPENVYSLQYLVVAGGGGGGLENGVDGADGGSDGGAVGHASSKPTVPISGGKGIIGQGHDGSGRNHASGNGTGQGGGGAGAAAVDKHGGAGAISSITGEDVYYAGGGGAGGYAVSANKKVR